MPFSPTECFIIPKSEIKRFSPQIFFEHDDTMAMKWLSDRFFMLFQ